MRHATPILLTAVLSGLAGCATPTATPAPPYTPPTVSEQAQERGGTPVEHPAPRLLVGDGAAGRSTLLDLGSGSALATFEHGAAPSLHASPNGRFGLAVQGKANRVEVVDGGAWTTTGGRHFVAPPKKLDLALHGAKPSHVVDHDGRIAAFFDDDGKAQAFDAADLPEGPLHPVTIPSPGPHHGVALPFGPNYLVTLPAPTRDELPVGVALHDPNGTVLAENRECPELHGEASLGRTALLACGDGIMLVTPTGAGATFEKLAYPAGPLGPDGDRRTFTLLVDEPRHAVLGKLTTGTELVRLDVAAKTMTAVPLPAGNSPLDLAPAAGGAVLTVTQDGTLHKLDPATGTVTARTKVAEPFTAEGEFSVPRPKLAVGGNRVFVSDPARGLVTELAADTLAVTRTLPVGGKPTNMVVLGATS